MGIIYGYARCSTNEKRQDIERQKRELFKLGVTEERLIYWEYESGTKKHRPELTKLMSIVRAGDTIATTEVSRLTRSTSHLCEMMKLVQERHLRLIIGTFTVDCRTSSIDPMTKGMLMMWGVFSEMERDIISERVKSGMQNAITKGKKVGRPPISVDTLPDRFWRYEKMYQQGQICVAEFARMMNCSRQTIYKYLHVAKRV